MILVTGASGYIGGQTLLDLKDAGHRVVAVDTVAPPEHLRGIPDRFYQEDFSRDYGLQLLDKFDFSAIIHCAGSSLVGPSLSWPWEYYQNNFVKTKMLLDRIVDHKISTRVIFSSSAACYGDPTTTPCVETDPCLPISPYGQSKLMIEWMLESYARAYDIDYVAFRYFNACGADSRARHGQKSGATHIIARVLESLRDSREFVLNGDDYQSSDGTCIRDYVHVQDISSAHIRACERDIPRGVYNLGTCQGYTNRQVIEMAEKITGRSLKVTVGPRRAGDPDVLVASPDKWVHTSGANLAWKLEHMIQHAWTWYCR